MKVWSALFNVVALVLITIWLSITLTMQDRYDDAYASIALKLKTEYATEAAIYTYVGNNVFWVDTYAAMMCNGYRMQDSQLNRDRVIDSIDAAIFVSNSSVEALRKNRNLNGYSVQLIPIAYDYSPTEKVMMDAFGDKVKYYRSTDKTLIEASNLDELQYILCGLGTYINVDDLKANKRVELARAINRALLTSYVGMNDTVQRTAYIPVDKMEELGINNVFGKTLIIIQKDFRKWDDRTITTAGYEKVEREWIVGFIENGIKYYCKPDEVPAGISNAPGNKLFKDIYEAAAAGYVPATHHFK